MALPREVRPILTGLCASLLLTASGCSNDGSKRLVGSVSTLSPSVSVAAPAATGQRFPGADARGHRAGDCVEVTYSDEGKPIDLKSARAPANGACIARGATPRSRLGAGADNGEPEDAPQR